MTFTWPWQHYSRSYQYYYIIRYLKPYNFCLKYFCLSFWFSRYLAGTGGLIHPVYVYTFIYLQGWIVIVIVKMYNCVIVTTNKNDIVNQYNLYIRYTRVQAAHTDICYKLHYLIRTWCVLSQNYIINNLFHLPRDSDTICFLHINLFADFVLTYTMTHAQNNVQ